MIQIAKSMLRNNLNLLLNIVTAIMIIMTLGYMGISLCKSAINMDSYYYIGASRFIMEGKVPFLDFPPGYTPLSFYIMCIPFSLFGVSFQVGLITLYLFDFINALLVYKLSRQYTENKRLAAFFAVLSILLCLNCDGGYYILEPFVLFFGLLALVILKKENPLHLILSGFFCFCAFWCKQYGLGFICLALLLIFLSNSFGKVLMKKWLLLLLGFFGGMIIFISLLMLQGVDPMRLLSLSGSDYEREGIIGFIGAWKTLLITLPLLIAPIVLTVIKLPKARHHQLLIVAFCGVFGFMLQCYVRFYAHYMILVMPFCALLLLAGIEAVKSPKMKELYILLLCLTPVIPCYFMVKDDITLLNSNEKAAQIQYANTIENIIPRGSDKVFASSDLHPAMLLNAYNPPMIEKHGLSNGFVTDPQETEKMIQASSYCVISKQRLEGERFTPEARAFLSSEFEELKFTSDGSQGDYSVFVRQK